ncbi:MAG: WecB/TagA/CpsF family glycosyltransferase [Patescibacteria group bacterium]|nr:WecB/TagA/CpsF family glycosyltransferase [Patescibacteria group bacterium]
MRVNILGVPIDAVTADQAFRFVTDAVLSGRRGLFVATPNPEMLVLASRDNNFADTLRRADLNIADGTGLLFAARFQGERLPGRVPGVEFMERLVAWAAETGRTVFLLGGIEPDTAERAAAALRKRHPNIKIVGAESGGQVYGAPNGDWLADDRVMEELRSAQPDLLFVAFGHRKQEQWIAQNLPSLPSVAVAMGVGGSFDFIAGRARRAPAIMRRLGLEWLWRLIREPKRWRRIIVAFIVFPWLVITSRQRYNE